jgi:LysM repeat protein
MRGIKNTNYLFTMILLFVFTFAGLALPGTASGSYYTVVEGDCFWDIANKLGVDVDALQAANPGVDVEALQIGEEILIPGAGSGDTYNAYTGGTFSYTVMPGDNLWSLAVRFGTSIESIKTASGLTSDFLQVGQALTIPGNAPSYQEASRGSVSRDYGDSDGTYGELIDWSNINDLFPIGSNATLQDFETGRKFRIHHLFGTNHADCEPLTAEDSYIMKQVFGGEWSWERRAAILWLDGRPVACSMAGMPHGTSQDIYGNDFDGMFDLHFLNSRTHGTDRVDPDHQAMVRRAAG